MTGTRSHYRESITSNVSGQLVVLPAATVYIYTVGTTTQITPVYQNSSSGATFSQPLTSDINGKIEFWLDGTENVDLNVSKTGYTTTTVTVTVQSPDTVVPANTANPSLQVDDITNANAVTGLRILSGAAGGGLNLSVIGGNTDENLSIDAKGGATISLDNKVVIQSGMESDLNVQRNSLPTSHPFQLDTDYQAVAYGTYTVNDALTILGEMRIVAWPA